MTLLFDAVLPLASAIDRPLVLTATGGTSVTWSPSMPWYRRLKLSLLRRLGIHAAVDVDRPGFYPAGGGRATLSLAPSSPSPLSLRERGDRTRAIIHSTATADLTDADVVERQADRAAERLTDDGVEVTERTARTVTADSTGTVVLVGFTYENGAIGADALGEPGKPAEDVADGAVDAVMADHETGAAVDAHLADQLLLWLATAGGAVRIPRVTDHVRTHCELVAQFGYDVRIAETTDGQPMLVADPGEQ